MAQRLENRVAGHEDLHVFNLKERLPEGPLPAEILDLAYFLYEGLIVRKEDFREAVANYDFSQHEGAHVAVRAPESALLPPWAVMRVGARLREAGARRVTLGSLDDARREAYQEAINDVDWDAYADKLVVLKADPDGEVPNFAYQAAADRLIGRARKVMFGEPGQATVVWREPQAETPRPQDVKKPDPPPPST
jgi:hypothetical protein